MKNNNPIFIDELNLSDDSYTYVSDCHNTTSWIDHILINKNLCNVISDVSVFYNTVASDHRPVLFSLHGAVNEPCIVNDSPICTNNTTISDWSKCDNISINNYMKCAHYCKM